MARSMKHLEWTLLVWAVVSMAGRTGTAAEDVVTRGNSSERERWDRHVARTTITRDHWGIPHVLGRSDADAVFGAIYAQAEDDFDRVETNFINSQGRLAEAEGESAIWRDLRMKLFIEPSEIRAQYEASPAWLRRLMIAWADGLNYFLATHPEVTPRVIRQFEPWMALTFSEGSIGGDIERVDLRDLEAFYAGRSTGNRVSAGERMAEPEPSGSNGFAIAPHRTEAGRALLLINPHTSFFFREELQMTSREGLNAYGAATWGQFFIYQGFNEDLGWMHTSSAVDAVDEYLETVVEKDGRPHYRYGAEEKPFLIRSIVVPYRTAGGMVEKRFTAYFTHFGPVVRSEKGRWVAIRLMHEPVKALMQSFLRTKARNLAEYRKTMALRANSSNNTLYADRKGNIAYFHANFVPIRDARFDWREPVDGADPASEWKGVHSFEEVPNVINPRGGWVYNANDWPWAAAGPDSPRQSDFPAYVDHGKASARGRHAVMVLEANRAFTLETLRDAAFDTYLPGFEQPIPELLAAYDAASSDHPLKRKLAEPIELLRRWDLRWNVESVPTSLAILHGVELGLDKEKKREREPSAEERLQALGVAVDRLEREFGSWRTPWGAINRFQRLNAKIRSEFDDTAPSTPIGFASEKWGSLAAFESRPREGTRRWYGTKGNSFVAVVEFGKAGVRAKAVTAGGLNSKVGSAHFNDQADRYARGEFREVYYYPRQLLGHIERTYHPGH